MKRISICALGLSSFVALGCPDDESSEGSADGTGGSSGSGSTSADDGQDTGNTGGNVTGSGSADQGSESDSADSDTADVDTGAMETGSTEDTGGSTGAGDTAGTDSGGSESSSDGMKVENCEAPGDLVTCDDFGSDPSWTQTIGLGCTGGVNEAIPVFGEGFNSPYTGAWAIATQFGTYEEAPGDPLWAPTEGEQMLVLSSGQAGTPDASGHITFSSLVNDSNGNPDDKPLPAPMSPLAGSGGAPFTGCDGIHDCSDSLINQWNAGGGGANDLIWFQFAVDVPGGTYGFSFDFAYFSEEFPEYVGTTFNDMFVVWSNSETYVGNLCFIDDQPCTVTALWPTQFQAGDPELANTGFTSDAATGWFQIKGSAEPEEALQLTFAVFDMGDTAFDTLVLLDHFAWDCEGCQPSEINPCGVVDPT